MVKIPVFFRQEMVAQSGGYSPSAEKPLKVVDDWRARGLPIDIHRPMSITPDLLCSVHNRTYVEGVLALQAKNGHGNFSAAIAKSCLFTCGAMLDATREAIRNDTVACAPVSGFHHACYDDGGGFCTFNGLMAAARYVLQHGLATQVAILDMDAHYPDGCYDILSHSCMQGMASNIHIKSLSEYRGENVQRCFRDIRNFVRDVSMFPNPVLLYQAGADAHVDDPLGAGILTTEQMRRRDEIVFKTAERYGVPVAWNLAGGYQRDQDGGISKVVELHRQTMEVCRDVYCRSAVAL
jgi:acetoin utilization deacetylase AcuC-like enzyme